jgi:hypothetical protein
MLLYHNYFDAVALFISTLFTTGLSFSNRFFNIALLLSSRFFNAPLFDNEGSNFAQTLYINFPFSCTHGPLTIEFIIFATDEFANA